MHTAIQDESVHEIRKVVLLKLYMVVFRIVRLMRNLNIVCLFNMYNVLMTILF